MVLAAGSVAAAPSTDVDLTPKVRVKVPAGAKAKPARHDGDKVFGLENDSSLVLHAIDMSKEGGCAGALDKQYERVAADKGKAGAKLRVDELAWKKTLGVKSMFAAYGVRSNAGVHGNRSLSFCEGDTMVGVTVIVRAELSAAEIRRSSTTSSHRSRANSSSQRAGADERVERRARAVVEQVGATGSLDRIGQQVLGAAEVVGLVHRPRLVADRRAGGVDPGALEGGVGASGPPSVHDGRACSRQAIGVEGFDDHDGSEPVPRVAGAAGRGSRIPRDLAALALAPLLVVRSP